MLTIRNKEEASRKGTYILWDGSKRAVKGVPVVECLPVDKMAKETTTDGSDGAARKAVVILLALTAAIFLFLALKSILQDANESSSYTEAAETYTQVADAASQTAEGSEIQQPGVDGSREVKEAAPITVDFDKLLAAAPDVVGWIYVEGTNINYPIVRGDDNSYYLTHDYAGNPSSAGSIMMDILCTGEFTDINTLIYGHSMSNGTMFAGLRKYFNTPGFFEQHPVFWILTPNKTFKAEIFSIHETTEMSEVYTCFLTRGTSYGNYLSAAKQQSIIDTGVDVGVEDSCIVLSTCKYATGSERLVIHAKLTEVS